MHYSFFFLNEISQPSPQLSEPTKPKSPWKISIPHASGNHHMLAKYNKVDIKLINYIEKKIKIGINPRRLQLQELKLKNELSRSCL